MDATDLRQTVEDAVKEKLDNEEAFTTADISHPIIKEDKKVRHHQVKTIIDEMDARGDMAVAEFEMTMITVYPQVGQTAQARLWHPEGYNTGDYKGGHKVLVRSDDPQNKIPDPPKSPPSKNKLVQTPGTDGTVAIQKRNDTLNISPVIVKKAGLTSGDYVAVSIPITGSGCKVEIYADTNGSQQVDKEGRIRLHGKKARAAVAPNSFADVSVDSGHIKIG
jgi:hypothetical protein